MIYEKVKQFIRSTDMLREGDLVLAGVSGGGDSMAMLDMLRRYQAEQIFTLAVIHVNHGIRGAEALRDQEHVVAYCEKWQIPYKIYAYSVPEYAAAQGLGLEEAGRLLRDRAFELAEAAVPEAPIAKAQSVRFALAHNQNDQAETVLHNLSRGSGLRGVMGILPVSGKKIRPLLCLQRSEIEQYLAEQSLTFVTDSSNQEDHYTRNRIRHNILPLLEQEVNRSAVSHLAETARQAALAEDYLTRQGVLLAKQYRMVGDDFHFLRDFFKQETVLRSYAVREALYLQAGSRKDLTSGHIRQILELENQPVHKQVCLPCGLEAVRTYEGILLRKKKDSPDHTGRADHTGDHAVFFPEQILPVPGSLEVPGGRLLTRIFPWQEQKIEENRYTKWLDYDKIQRNLSVRTRKTGDFLTVDARGSHKKLNRCLIDDKIPLQMRDKIPLVVSGQEVLWIVGGRMGETCKITSGTRQVLEITYEGGKAE